MKMTVVSKAKMEIFRKEMKARYVQQLLDSLEYSRHYCMESILDDEGRIIGYKEFDDMSEEDAVRLRVIDEIAEVLAKCV